MQTLSLPIDRLDFCDALDLEAVVPDRYANYRPAVADGIKFFLENLSVDRVAAILAEQAAMPEATGADERLAAIARHCPVLHKLGQVLARDRRLPSGLRHHLQKLETMEPTRSLADVRPALETELGPLARLDVVLDEEPLAEASVAIVIPFSHVPADGAPPRRGVFKLLKEGIEQRLEEELELLQRIGSLLDERCAAYGLPAIDYAGTFGRVRDLLEQEIRLDREQAHLRAAAATYKQKSWVVIPDVFDFSTSRLTAMTRIDGVKVTDAHHLPASARRLLAERIVRAMIALPLWSPGALFHADPHAGNLIVTDDLRLGILDWSLVGALSDQESTCLSQILIGALTLDSARISSAIAAMAANGIDAAALETVVDRHVRRLPEGTLPGLGWLVRLMDDAVVEAQGRFNATPILFRKVLQTLDGVVKDVSADCRTDQVLAGSFLRQLAREWGPRSFALPFSRDFPTRLSNAELSHLLLSGTLTGSRYLGQVQQQLYDRVMGAPMPPSRASE